jgi:hypothetical protein
MLRPVNRRGLVVVLRLAFAALTLAAIATQLGDLAARGTLNPVNFFSYFTIQSNLIGVVAFGWSAVGVGRPARGPDLLRGAATVYLTVTFVVFALLLSGTDVDTAIPWVNSVLHGVFPIAVVLDWALVPPRSSISVRESLVWLSYPIAWVAYTMLRGPIAAWYPYPFLDPANGGYGSVAAYVVGIFVFGAVLCAAVSAVGRRPGWRLLPD